MAIPAFRMRSMPWMQQVGNRDSRRLDSRFEPSQKDASRRWLREPGGYVPQFKLLVLYRMRVSTVSSRFWAMSPDCH